MMSRQLRETEPEIPNLKRALVMMFEMGQDLSASENFDDKVEAQKINAVYIKAMSELDNLRLAWRAKTLSEYRPETVP